MSHQNHFVWLIFVSFCCGVAVVGCQPVLQNEGQVTAVVVVSSTPTHTSTPTPFDLPAPTKTPTEVPSSTSTMTPSSTPNSSPTPFMSRTPTLTPSPTYTPMPPYEPGTDSIAWGVIFRGLPCDTGFVCGDILGMGHEWQNYFMRYDKQLVAKLDEVDFIPIEYYADGLPYSLSADYEQLVYLERDIGYRVHHPNNPDLDYLIDDFNSSFLTLNHMPHIQHLFQTDCFALFTRDAVDGDLFLTQGIQVEQKCRDESSQNIDYTTSYLPSKHFFWKRNTRISLTGEKYVYPTFQNEIFSLVRKQISEPEGEIIFQYETSCEIYDESIGSRITVLDFYQMANDAGLKFIVSEVCDPPSGMATEELGNYLKTAWHGIATVYVIDWDGNNLAEPVELIFHLNHYPETDERVAISVPYHMTTGAWSPDGRYFVFTFHQGHQGEDTGLYVWDTEQQTIAKMLMNYFVTDITTYPILISNRDLEE